MAGSINPATNTTCSFLNVERNITPVSTRAETQKSNDVKLTRSESCGLETLAGLMTAPPLKTKRSKSKNNFLCECKMNPRFNVVQKLKYIDVLGGPRGLRPVQKNVST